LYVEDFKRGPNKDIGPKDIFELASKGIYADLEMRRSNNRLMREPNRRVL
jgi:hypothetical protein